MNKYVYKNKLKATWNQSKSFWDYEIVFECFAQSISEADSLFSQKTGIDPIKTNHIGVSIEWEEDKPKL